MAGTYQHSLAVSAVAAAAATAAWSACSVVALTAAARCLSPADAARALAAGAWTPVGWGEILTLLLRWHPRLVPQSPTPNFTTDMCYKKCESHRCLQ